MEDRDTQWILFLISMVLLMSLCMVVTSCSAHEIVKAYKIECDDAKVKITYDIEDKDLKTKGL